MKNELPKYSKSFGSYEAHPIEGEYSLEGKFLMVTDEDIRKEVKIKPKLLDIYKDEYLFLFTQDQLDRLAEHWECEPLEKSFEVDAEYVLSLMYKWLISP